LAGTRAAIAERVVSVSAIVLAGGAGRRLASLVPTTIRRAPLPKQFCSFGARRSLLQQTVRRMLRVAEPRRVMVVVDDEHLPRARQQLAQTPCCLVSQPCARGTGVAAALALVELARSEPHGLVVVVPSDQVFRHTAPFLTALRRGCAVVREVPERLLVLGSRAETPATDVGWLMLDAAERRGILPVACFLPAANDSAVARLRDTSAAWNAAVLIGFAPVLLRAIETAAGRSLDSLRSLGSFGPFYDALPHLDLWTHVVPRHAGVDAMILPESVGLIDLDTPEGVTRWRSGL
jgi:mannose-1-phosphate guanylyltransferase